MSDIKKFRTYVRFLREMHEVREIIFDKGTVMIDAYQYGLDRDDAPVMQFTGLTDKNGVEIYEGDILGSEKSDSDAWYVSHHQVVWHDSGLMGKQICSNGSYIGIDYHINRTSHPYVVIGNIYQNPELLENK